MRDVKRFCIFCREPLSACMGFVVPTLLGFLENMEKGVITPDTMRVEVCGLCMVKLIEVLRLEPVTAYKEANRSMEELYSE